ncbi:XRE family transcriptional regulator [Candidatus Kaiserbacteria bacterium]|nr:XRE family transcriptional regulator [Candidatus Kaiserbacteria bacterium]
MKISHDELAKFLDAANKSTYANKDAPKSASLRPSSEDYHFELGDLAYHDTYFGARDFIGEEVVYKISKPVWGMNYYGYLLNPDISADEVYTVLRSALYSDTLPVRGPREHIRGTSKYANQVDGTLNRFSGEEKIYFDTELVYCCWYHGGSIE